MTNDDFHGCKTGDCPHEKQVECDKALAEDGLRHTRQCGRFSDVYYCADDCPIKNGFPLSDRVKHTPAVIPDPTPDLVVTSDHQGPISLEGTAIGRMRGTTTIAYFVVYKVGSRLDRVPVPKEFYDQVRNLFSTIRNANLDAVHAWANSPQPDMATRALMD